MINIGGINLNVKNLNCIFNDNVFWCKNKNIKRSLFGLGARCCIEHNSKEIIVCPFKIKHLKPNILPAPQK